MTRFRCWLAALFVAIIPLQLAAAPVRKHAPAHAAAPAQDWSAVANRTPSGAFVWGKPDARVRVVEYLSLTCPHCAHFEGEAIPPLTAKYIRPGLANYEIRHALRDTFDFAGSLLARCDGPRAFFAVMPKVFAQQDVWFTRAQSWSQVEQADGMPADQLLDKSARGAGFDSVFAMPLAKMDACLANKSEQALLTAQASEAWHRPEFPGTPAFMINGVLRSDVRSWADLDGAIAVALHPHPSPRKSVRK
ncbi:MAG TPA: thioredoxin domain-containing protein [Sphingomonas sp.]|uniref:thioredoxin domain-containing protein n=1 Tax=Sphingomonas sp. TaxID=28214 RepID=UPI002C6B9F04|nr:thioredoxin domain-containing protein [Sphingomonas sp.]HMI20698.1 thioredoxin domain-containing protein [Sphingomonas sp.]